MRSADAPPPLTAQTIVERFNAVTHPDEPRETLDVNAARFAFGDAVEHWAEVPRRSTFTCTEFDPVLAQRLRSTAPEWVHATLTWLEAGGCLIVVELGPAVGYPYPPYLNGGTYTKGRIRLT